MRNWRRSPPESHPTPDEVASEVAVEVEQCPNGSASGNKNTMPKVTSPSGLTAKQERFIAEYLVDLNQKQAAIRAGYSERTAAKIASELMQKPHVRAAT